MEPGLSIERFVEDFGLVFFKVLPFFDLRSVDDLPSTSRVSALLTEGLGGRPSCPEHDALSDTVTAGLPDGGLPIGRLCLGAMLLEATPPSTASFLGGCGLGVLVGGDSSDSVDPCFLGLAFLEADGFLSPVLVFLVLVMLREDVRPDVLGLMLSADARRFMTSVCEADFGLRLPPAVLGLRLTPLDTRFTEALSGVLILRLILDRRDVLVSVPPCIGTDILRGEVVRCRACDFPSCCGDERDLLLGDRENVPLVVESPVMPFLSRAVRYMYVNWSSSTP